MSARDTVRASGADAGTYLQGQISQDVESLVDGATAWSLLLQPTGKLVSWFRIHRVGADEYLLDIDAGHAEAMIGRLERFKLRTDVSFEAVDHISIPAPVEWPGAADPSDERLRILAGMPRMGAELTEQTIPGEGGERFIDLSVSFTKGCYTGQELVARIDSRGGNVPRPIRVLVAEGPVEVDDDVTLDGDVVGRVSSAVGDVALAPLKRRVEIGDLVRVGEVHATVAEPAQSEGTTSNSTT